VPEEHLGAGNAAIQVRPDGSKWVKIFYATDRSATFSAIVPDSDALGSSGAAIAIADDARSPWQQHLPVLFCIVGTVVAAGFAYMFSYRKAGTVMLLSGTVIAAIVFGTQGSRLGWFGSDSQRTVEYGAARDQLRFGVCQVSLPPGHERGTMESPSFLHLEWRPDPKKHVALLETIELDREECLAKLKEDLAKSDRQEIFVFIHGYNVTFEDAARRTGQLAHDLDFPGPAMLYSWPSQGTTAGYPVDENNVAWTVPHLKDVLQTLQRQTGADAVHVVAHSMGNRALTAAVRELALEGKMTDAPLGQIVLAAPDVDAEVFRRDLLPAMQASAERVTLYASSYDRALIVSKTLHGYPRAGESGEGLVLAEGLETIDVSGIDLSLLGHSYYGDVVHVVDDLKTLIFENKAAAARPYLLARERQGLGYWQVAMQPPVAQQPATITPR
jgi:esterase/lipase superfamily enzyme